VLAECKNTSETAHKVQADLPLSRPDQSQLLASRLLRLLLNQPTACSRPGG
jgi:hypothetical protein